MNFGHTYLAWSRRAATALAVLLAGVGAASATPISNARIVRDVDWVSAARGGIGGRCGNPVEGMLSVSGMTGPATRAWLYWHGVDADLCTTHSQVGGGSETALQATSMATFGGGCNGVFDVSTLDFNGTMVTGTPIGDATTNCWGPGSSRAYRADVTALVGGNGKYTYAIHGGDACDDVNGISLVITFDDGNPLNDRDLVFFEGNDSNYAENVPGETDGWHATLAGIHFIEGTARAQLHVADGQQFDANGLDDGALTFSAGAAPVVIPDALHRYDGDSTPDSGDGRSEADGTPGSLWDVHTFDITGLFTGEATYTLQLDGMTDTDDCLGLVLLLVDLEAGSIPVSATQRSWGSLKAIYR